MLSDCYKTKTYQVLEAKIEQMWEPDYRPNQQGFMSQQVVLSDASGQHTVTVSTKFKDGFVKPEEQGQTHTWKIKCYDGQLSGYTQKPAQQGGNTGYSPPSQAQTQQYKQAGGETVKNLHPYNDPKTESIHRQCAMKAAIEVVVAKGAIEDEEVMLNLVDWANFFVHYYRTGNANMPDASITEPAATDADTDNHGMGQDPF